jgi:hypothetical protein
MRNLRLMAVAIFAICAFSAVLASSASAAEISYTGPGSFKISSGAGELESSGKLKITCTGDTGTGQLGATPTKSAELTVTFVGCETLAKPCTSSGATAGNIQTVKVKGAIGDINKTAKEVGVLLTPASGTAFVVPVKCGSIAFAATGSVVAKLTPTETLTKTLTATFTQSGGLQTVKKFEGESTNHNLISEIGASGPEEAGLKSTETLTLTSGEGTLKV